MKANASTASQSIKEGTLAPFDNIVTRLQTSTSLWKRRYGIETASVWHGLSAQGMVLYGTVSELMEKYKGLKIDLIAFAEYDLSTLSHNHIERTQIPGLDEISFLQRSTCRRGTLNDRVPRRKRSWMLQIRSLHLSLVCFRCSLKEDLSVS